MLMLRVAGCSKPSSTTPSLTPLRAPPRFCQCPRPICLPESLPSHRAANGSDPSNQKTILSAGRLIQGRNALRQKSCGLFQESDLAGFENGDADKRDGLCGESWTITTTDFLARVRAL